MQKIKAHIADNVEVLNPNTLMSRFLFTLGSDLNHSKSDVGIRVVSKIVLEDKKISSISNLIKDVSIKSANALVNYEHMPELFTL